MASGVLKKSIAKSKINKTLITIITETYEYVLYLKDNIIHFIPYELNFSFFNIIIIAIQNFEIF